MSHLSGKLRCSIVTLSGSGWLFPYHIGVLEILEQNGVLKPSTPIQGLSGGALIAAGVASGVPPAEMMKTAIENSAQLRNESPSATVLGSVRGVWGRSSHTLHQALHDVLPKDAWQKCNGRLSLWLTPWPPRSLGEARQPPKRIDSFHSNEDLIGACLCSAHLPFYMDRRLSRVWRGRRWVDGGLYDIIPPCPEAVDASAVIMSCPLEILTRSRTDRHRLICPSPSQISKAKLLSWFLAPPREEDLELLRDAGRRNAEAWLARDAD